MIATLVWRVVGGVGAMVGVDEERERRGAKVVEDEPDEVVLFWYVRDAAAREIEER